jgi:hypothetical protein
MVALAHQCSRLHQSLAQPHQIVEGRHLPRQVVQADRLRAGGRRAGGVTDGEEGDVMVVVRCRGVQEGVLALWIHREDLEVEHALIEARRLFGVAHVEHRVVHPGDGHCDLRQ